MRDFRGLLFFIVSVFFAGHAFALVPTGSGWRWIGDTGPTSGTPEAACQAHGVPSAVAPASFERVDPTSPATDRACVWRRTPSNTLVQSGAVRPVADVCPANSTAVTGGCQCAAGFDESAGQCVPHVNACTSKGSYVVNMTVGWQRTPLISSNEPMIGNYPFPGGSATMCVGGCSTEVSPSEPCPGCQANVSKSANDQGLYRVSAEFMGKATGAECTSTPSDAPVTPDNSKDPPCPGYVGEVNGVKGCYGTASKPVVTVPPATAGSSLPKVPGNPPAGPSSPGASTPVSGSGGSAGGPAAAASAPSGSGGSGTVTGSQNGTGRVSTQSGTEQVACGAPGQPVCAVKVDEAGMPSIGNTFDSGNAGLDSAKASAESGINSAHSIQAPTWSFSFQLPTGCSSYQVGSFKGLAFTMNPCAYQSTIHDLMSMIWAAVTAFCIIGMVGRTIRES